MGAIEKEVFSNPWHPGTFRSLLMRRQVAVSVAEVPGTGVVGYSVMWWVLDQGELANLAVRKDYRNRGIGARLLDAAVEALAAEGVVSLFLEVRESNEAAHRLYRSRGFRHVGTRRAYYRNPTEDALILEKALVP